MERGRPPAPRHDGAATLIWAASEVNRQCAETKRWRQLIPRLEVKTVPGDHLTFVTQHADVLAEHLRASFSRNSAD